MRHLAPRVWFWSPQWYWYGWRTLIPVYFGGDEYNRLTVVLGWTITGRIIVALSRSTSSRVVQHEEILEWSELRTALGYFAGKRMKRMPPSEGYLEVVLKAAKWGADLSKSELMSVVGDALYGWSPDEPNDATGLVALTEVKEVTEAVWKWLGIDSPRDTE